MKKVLMVAAMLFVGMFTYCYGQDVKVNINNQDYSTSNGEFKINGISSSEDIGGVDVDFRTKVNDPQRNTTDLFVVFTNYNNSPVTVLSTIEFWQANIGDCNKTISCVLGVGMTKEIKLNDTWNSYGGSVKGMIVRKVGQ